MNFNFIQIKFKDKNSINYNNNKTFELFRLSIGNNINKLKYPFKSNKYSLDNKFIYKMTNLLSQKYYKNKNQSSNQNLEIIYRNKFIKKNIAKMIYKITENRKETKILNKIFISRNMKRAKVIINNKQYNLIERIKNEKNKKYKIKIKFFDNIFNINSMFKDCKLLYSIYNLQNLNTKYLKSISNLFYGCHSLLYIEDISNWHINNINDISCLFKECFSLEILPNISKWNINSINNISEMFCECSSLETLPDISNWETSEIIDMSYLFYNCSSLKLLPDISKWNISNANDISEMFGGCSSLIEIIQYF